MLSAQDIIKKYPKDKMILKRVNERLKDIENDIVLCASKGEDHFEFQLDKDLEEAVLNTLTQKGYQLTKCKQIIYVSYYKISWPCKD